MGRRNCVFKETWLLFRKNLSLIKSAFFNFLFVLDKKGARMRIAFLVGTFLFIWFLLTSQTLDGEVAKGFLQKSFAFVLSRQAENANAPSMLVITLSQSLFSFSVFRFFSILFFPFIGAFLGAVKYLTDIYELNDEQIAAKFIWQAAFGSKYGTIKIEEGALSKSSESSPIVKIGGPGKVNIDLYSAALFEKADGRPHVLSAASKGVELQAFERYKTAIDLRDQIVAPVETLSRTVEGIKVSAKDVRMVYSILRGEENVDEQKKTYPFKKEAIPSYYYQKGSSVSAYAKKDFNDSPLNPMPGIIKGELSGFITRNKLSEFLTSVGEPEKDELKERVEKYQKERERVGRVINRTPPPSADDFEAPDFRSRDDVNQLFSQFAADFSRKKYQKGVSLYWVGTGTWVPPDDIIPEKNMEAWKLTQENAKRGANGKIKGAENGEKIEETLRLIQQVPLSPATLISAPNSYRGQILTEILERYTELIKNAKDLLDIYEEDFEDLTENDLDDAAEQLTENIRAYWVNNRAVG